MERVISEISHSVFEKQNIWSAFNLILELHNKDSNISLVTILQNMKGG
jgi:hypothetical protein